MKKIPLTLYLEINNFNFIFLVGESNSYENFKIIYKMEVSTEGIEQNRIIDLEKTFNIIKKNIFLIEQKLNYTFKDVVLILDSFNIKFINISGFKKMNGSQILRENITHILNKLKSCVDETELKKIILHIFNSKFYLDYKKIENLPIGLFSDFYAHELSFSLIDTNDYKNLNYIFDKCGLIIKKILIKSFIKGANISHNYKNIDTFFCVMIGNKNSKIFYFENDSLKSEQNFNFGIDIILRDISKVTSLKMHTIKKILEQTELKKEEITEDDLLEKKFFEESGFRKIKKKLIYEIAEARIREIVDLVIFQNINFGHYVKKTENIFLEIDQIEKYKFLHSIFKDIFLTKANYKLNFLDDSSNESILSSANKIVHYGWSKEAIPITEMKKSIIARFFEAIFG